MPAGDAKFYRSPFLRDFWHLNVAMMTSNNALVPDPDKEDILASKPFDWPFLHLGLRMCGWGDNQIKYYLLGTPVVAWGGSVSLIVGLLSFGFYLLRRQRKYLDMEPRKSIRLDIAIDGMVFTPSLLLLQANGNISSMWGRSRSLVGLFIIVSEVTIWFVLLADRYHSFQCHS